MTRPASERAAHARARLATEPNVWIASASPDGVPHLVPLSLAWVNEAIVVATPESTPTARNITRTGRARASLESADDVVIFDTAASVQPFDASDPQLIAAFIERVGWDPRELPGDWAMLTLKPERGHAWIGPAEIEGRTIVRNGTWVDADLP